MVGERRFSVSTLLRVLLLISWLIRLLFARVGLLIVSGDDRYAEILGLRHQINVLQGQINKPKFTQRGSWRARRAGRTVRPQATRTGISDRQAGNGDRLAPPPRRTTYAYKTVRAGRPATSAELRRLVL